MDATGANEKLERLQKFEIGLLSRQFSDVLSTYEEVRKFMQKYRDGIFVTAVFLKLADIFGKASHATRMLIVKACSTYLTGSQIMSEFGYLFDCTTNKDEIMKQLLRPLSSNSSEQRMDSHLMAQTLGPYYHNKFAVLHEVVDALRRTSSKTELRVGNQVIRSLCQRTATFADAVVEGVEKLAVDKTIPRETLAVLVESLGHVQEGNMVVAYNVLVRLIFAWAKADPRCCMSAIKAVGKLALRSEAFFKHAVELCLGIEGGIDAKLRTGIHGTLAEMLSTCKRAVDSTVASRLLEMATRATLELPKNSAAELLNVLCLNLLRGEGRIAVQRLMSPDLCQKTQAVVPLLVLSGHLDSEDTIRRLIEYCADRRTELGRILRELSETEQRSMLLSLGRQVVSPEISYTRIKQCLCAFAALRKLGILSESKDASSILSTLLSKAEPNLLCKAFDMLRSPEILAASSWVSYVACEHALTHPGNEFATIYGVAKTFCEREKDPKSLAYNWMRFVRSWSKYGALWGVSKDVLRAASLLNEAKEYAVLALTDFYTLEWHKVVGPEKVSPAWVKQAVADSLQLRYLVYQELLCSCFSQLLLFDKAKESEKVRGEIENYLTRAYNMQRLTTTYELSVFQPKFRATHEAVLRETYSLVSSLDSCSAKDVFQVFPRLPLIRVQGAGPGSAATSPCLAPDLYAALLPTACPPAAREPARPFPRSQSFFYLRLQDLVTNRVYWVKTTVELDLEHSGMRGKYRAKTLPKDIVVKYRLRNGLAWEYETRIKVGPLQRVYPSSCMLQLDKKGMYELEIGAELYGKDGLKIGTRSFVITQMNSKPCVVQLLAQLNCSTQGQFARNLHQVNALFQQPLCGPIC